MPARLPPPNSLRKNELAREQSRSKSFGAPLYSRVHTKCIRYPQLQSLSLVNAIGLNNFPVHVTYFSSRNILLVAEWSRCEVRQDALNLTKVDL